MASKSETDLFIKTQSLKYVYLAVQKEEDLSVRLLEHVDDWMADYFLFSYGDSALVAEGFKLANHFFTLEHLRVLPLTLINFLTSLLLKRIQELVKHYQKEQFSHQFDSFMIFRVLRQIIQVEPLTVSQIRDILPDLEKYANMLETGLDAPNDQEVILMTCLIDRNYDCLLNHGPILFNQTLVYLTCSECLSFRTRCVTLYKL